MPSKLKYKKQFKVDSNLEVCWNCEYIRLGIPFKCSLTKLAIGDVCRTTCKDFSMYSQKIKSRLMP